MATITIDSKQYEVKADQNLLQACLSLGFNLPYFCWHPAMGAVGACRQCAIKLFKDEKDTIGRIVMSCMTPIADGLRISIDDPEARQFRASVIEWLMVNHPHDCPVCDEGGECHLQDMTVMTGHNTREFRFQKRTHNNQDLGPFINHEMNRCIACYRCLRFYRDYAGGRDFDVFGAHDFVYFGRQTDGVLENEFSGNLVEICPTGVFDDKTFMHHYTRKWDLQTAPSLCVHCSLGCNTIPGARYEKLRRIRNRFNGAVNGYFLCDRGRYGYEFVNSNRRLRQPLLRDQPVTREQALQHVAALLVDKTKVIGIGSPRASLEANFALRALVGPARFYTGDEPLASAALKILQGCPARIASLHDAQVADAVLVLGEDLTNVAPLLALALRQAVRQQPLKQAAALEIAAWNDGAAREFIHGRKGPCYIATTAPTKLDEIATKTVRAAPADIARLGFAVAHALNPNAPGASHPLAAEIAAALLAAERPLIITGTSCGSEAILQAAANVAQTLDKAQLCFTMPECNSLGLALLGGRTLPDTQAQFQADTVIVLEDDLARRPPLAELLANAKHIVALDHLSHATTLQAEVVLPAATFAESSGTLVNNEGRAQRFYQVLAPIDGIQASWRWLRDLLGASWANLDEITAAMAAEVPVLQPVLEIAPPAGFRIVGQKIPRESHRYSGRTAMHANLNMHEPQPPVDPDSPLAFSMEGHEGQPPSSLIPSFWAPGWNSIQALNRFQGEVGGPLRGGDPGKCLIEPASSSNYFVEIPPAFQRREGQWLVVPLYHIFGSDELSALSPGIAELAPEPYVAMNPEEAPAAEVTLTIAGVGQRLPVKPMAGLPLGIVGVYQPLAGHAPTWSTIIP